MVGLLADLRQARSDDESAKLPSLFAQMGYHRFYRCDSPPPVARVVPSAVSRWDRPAWDVQKFPIWNWYTSWAMIGISIQRSARTDSIRRARTLISTVEGEFQWRNRGKNRGTWLQ